MSATSVTTSFNKIASLTARHLANKGKIEDAVFKSNMTLDRFRKSGIVKDYTGGTAIDVNLEYGKTLAVGSTSGYGQLSTVPSDPITRGTTTIREYYANVPMSSLEVDIQNKGPEQLVKLATTMINNGTSTLTELIQKDMWDITLSTATTGNSGKNIHSIPQFVQTLDSGATTTKDIDILGIDQSAETWWKNTCMTATGTCTFATLTSEIRKSHALTGKGTGGPANLAIADLDTWLSYLNALDNRVQYTTTEKADIGFRGVVCDGAELIWDQFVPDAESGYASIAADSSSSWAAGSLYWLRTKDWDFYQVPSQKFSVMSPVDMLPHQKAKVIPILWSGQLICRNRRNQGLLYDIDTEIQA